MEYDKEVQTITDILNALKQFGNKDEIIEAIKPSLQDIETDWHMEETYRSRVAYLEMQEYVRVSKEEYEELKQIKEGIETIKGYGLPDDTQFVLMTKEDYERNQKQYEVLYNGKLEEKENTINTPNYYKQKYEELVRFKEAVKNDDKLMKNKLDEIKELADMELHCCNDTNTTKSMKKMLQIIERKII